MALGREAGVNAPELDRRAVVLMALGGPTSLADVEPYLRDLRGGRPTPPELVDEFRERYRRIGGGSPLVAVTRSQAAALERRLEGSTAAARCEFGMRHWRPSIVDAVRRLVDDGYRDLTGLCLTPYYSAWSVGGYHAALRAAVAEVDPSVRIRTVDHWHDAPTLAPAFAKRIVGRRAAMAERGFPDPRILFTAHSLPGVTDPEREPYVLELAETRREIERRAGPMRSRMAYQSVGRREGPWLGPPAEGEIERLAAEGEGSVLVVPYGFVSDNLEILFDVDLEMRDLAGRLGLGFERTDSLNDDPLLIEALAHAVRRAVPADGP